MTDTHSTRKRREEKRSAAQSSAVIVRMSPAERDALHRAAAARGISTAQLLRQQVTGLISDQQAN